MPAISSAAIVLVLANVAQTSSFVTSNSYVHKISNGMSGSRALAMKSQASSSDAMSFSKKCSKVLVSSFLAFNLIGNLDMASVKADDAVPATPTETVTPPAPSTPSLSSAEIPKVPLYTKKGTDTQAYSDVGRGFRMLRWEDCLFVAKSMSTNSLSVSTAHLTAR